MSTIQCVSNNLRVREKGIVILALYIFIHNAVYYRLTKYIYTEACRRVYACVCEKESEGSYPFLVVLYSTLRMGLQGSGFFPSLGCFPKKETDNVLLASSTLLPSSRFLLSSFLHPEAALKMQL